ncbi:MAG: von Willebrand factor type A domain-containing protein [Bradymonadales bacterium]
MRVFRYFLLLSFLLFATSCQPKGGGTEFADSDKNGQATDSQIVDEADEAKLDPQPKVDESAEKESEPIVVDQRDDAEIAAKRKAGAEALSAILAEQAKLEAELQSEDSEGNFVGGRAAAKTGGVYASPPPGAIRLSPRGGSGGGHFGIARDMALPDFNTAEFSDFDPNRFMSVAANPLSTFGADVDTASYSIFRRMVNEGSIREVGVFRSEEMINYFRYDYPQPREGEPFSVTAELAPCPWNKDTGLLLLGLATKTLPANQRPDSNLVFLLDVSGSMLSNDKLPLLKKALLLLVDQMGPRDRISIVTYASTQRLVLEAASYEDKKKIAAALEALEAGGFTAGDKGIQMAYAAAEKHFIKGGNNRIILGTDGDLNVGVTSESELKALVEEKRKSGVFLSVLGFGIDNVKDNKMETLANHGNGSYHYIDTIGEARKVLVDEMSQTMFVAAKDVKFQAEFNPSKIKGYRLIGYETRKLNAEDFADDKKDAGEVGAGHQVTVLYEIVEKGSAYPIAEVETKYQKKEAIPSDELLTLNIRYKAPDGETSKLLTYPLDESIRKPTMSENLSFASAVAQIAMIVNKSPFVGTASLDSVIEQLSAHTKLQKDEDKLEFLALVRRLKTLK